MFAGATDVAAERLDVGRGRACGERPVDERAEAGGDAIAGLMIAVVRIGSEEVLEAHRSVVQPGPEVELRHRELVLVGAEDSIADRDSWRHRSNARRRGTVCPMVATYSSPVALVVVDVQNDFAEPSGALSVPGGEEVVRAVNDEIVAATTDGALVVYTQDWHPPRTPHFVTDGGPWPIHCVRDTWGAALHPDLVVAGPVVRKGTGGEDGYSGFTMRDPVTGEDMSTGLDEMLRDAGIQRVVVVGLALDYCVKATALDAVALGYACEVPLAATAAVEVSPGDGQQAIEELEAAGVRVVS